jgi:hypothetical protein
VIWIAAYIAFCIGLAWLNAELIKVGKRIYHALNGVAHLACWLVIFLVTKEWVLLAALPFIGRVFFDSALNMMRGLPLDYVAKNPKSIIDKAEKGLFGNDGLLPKCIYLFISITLIIVYATH